MPDVPIIRSPANQLIKTLRRLQRSAVRTEEQRFVVEGRRAIDGFIAHGWVPELLILEQSREWPGAWPAVTGFRCHQDAFARLSSVATPSGYAAVFAIPATAPLDTSAGGLLLLGLADPGNLGSLLRSAAAFGLTQVITVGGADPFAPKVVAASAGALAALRVQVHPDDTTPQALGSMSYCALVPRGGVAPAQLRGQGYWLVIGSEAHGIPDEWLVACQAHLTLPMASQVESLNAAVAGSIAMWAIYGDSRES